MGGKRDCQEKYKGDNGQIRPTFNNNHLDHMNATKTLKFPREME